MTEYNNMICRKLKKTDYQQFLNLIRDFRDTVFTQEEFENIYNKITINSDILVLEHNNTLIATGTLIYEYKFIFNICILGHIEDVCVKKEFRGNGMGKYIISELVKLAKEKKCYKVVLDCSDSNIKFYEKCNFEKRGNQMSLLVN